jgi:hypothetical protein
MTVLSASYASGSSNILGGSANRILYQSAANVTATDANFIWTGTVLNLGSATGSVQVPYTGKFASSLDNTNHYLPHDGSGTSILRTNNVDKIKIGYGTAGNIDISGSTNITNVTTPTKSSNNDIIELEYYKNDKVNNASNQESDILLSIKKETFPSGQIVYFIFYYFINYFFTLIT